MKNINVAALQLTSTPDKNKNFKQIKTVLGKIKKGSIKLLVLPEVFASCGNPEEDFNTAENFKNNSAILMLQEIARSKKLYIAGGSVSIRQADSKKINNRLAFINPEGKILNYYDKIHLFDVDFSKKASFKESDTVEAGKKIVVVNTDFAKIGFAICYDLRFPELFRKLALLGAEIIVIPAAFITKTGFAHWEVLLRARAIENQVFIIASNQVGTHTPSRHTYGDSMIIDPWGRILARGKANTAKKPQIFKPELIKAKLNAKILHDFRTNMPCLSNAKVLKNFSDY